jgi:hypothetical protein
LSLKAVFMRIIWIAGFSLAALLAPGVATAAPCKALKELVETQEDCELSDPGIALNGAVLLKEDAEVPDQTHLNQDGVANVYVKDENDQQGEGKLLRISIASGTVEKVELAKHCSAFLEAGWQLPKDSEGDFCWFKSREEFGLKEATLDGKPLRRLRIDTWPLPEDKVLIGNVQLLRAAMDGGPEDEPTVILVRIEPAPAKDGKAKDENATTPECSDAKFDLPLGHELWNRCKDAGYLCVTPSGQVLSRPPMEEGMSVTIALVHPEFRGHEFELDVEFERATVLNILGLEADRTDSVAWVLGAQHTVRLSSAGTLHITTRIDPKDPDAEFETGPERCRVSTVVTKKHAFDVRGHYHFMLGVMPTLAGLYDRKHTLNRSDDGVQRVYEQDIRSVDWALTLSGYPWGVSPDDFGAFGILVGTSMRDIGERWYAGLEWDSPIGLGLVGGAAVIVVPELDRDFLAGQPLTDTQVPVHDSVAVTWFLGINIEARLFAKAFEKLAGDDDE